jgi:hypothetical protein
VRILGVLVMEVAVHWALALAGLFGHWLWDMLFVVVAGGRGVCDVGLSGVTLACSGGIVVWLVIWRRVSVVVILVFRMGVGVLV